MQQAAINGLPLPCTSTCQWQCERGRSILIKWCSKTEQRVNNRTIIWLSATEERKNKIFRMTGKSFFLWCSIQDKLENYMVNESFILFSFKGPGFVQSQTPSSSDDGHVFRWPSLHKWPPSFLAVHSLIRPDRQCSKARSRRERELLLKWISETRSYWAASDRKEQKLDAIWT